MSTTVLIPKKRTFLGDRGAAVEGGTGTLSSVIAFEGDHVAPFDVNMPAVYRG
jgi:hypothetical protein